MTEPQPTPVGITDHRRSRVVQIDWSDGRSHRLPHARLRAGCRCALCEQQRRSGHAPTPDPEVTLVSVDPVGEHGLSFGFSDGHARGIYPWPYLRELGDTAPT